MLPGGNWLEPRLARGLVFPQQSCGCEPVGSARERDPRVLRDGRDTSRISPPMSDVTETVPVAF